MDEAALAAVRSAIGTRIGVGAVPSQGFALHAADIKAMPLHPFSLLVLSAVFRECFPICCVQVPAPRLIYTNQSFSMLPQCKFVQLPRLRGSKGPPWESCSEFICGLEKLAIILSQLILLSWPYPAISKVAVRRRTGDTSASTNIGTSWHIGRHTTCAPSRIRARCRSVRRHLPTNRICQLVDTRTRLERLVPSIEFVGGSGLNIQDPAFSERMLGHRPAKLHHQDVQHKPVTQRIQHNLVAEALAESGKSGHNSEEPLGSACSDVYAGDAAEQQAAAAADRTSNSRAQHIEEAPRCRRKKRN